MPFYTPVSLNSFPSHFTMNANLPSMELVSTWTSWRAKQIAPLTPPMTSTFHTRTPIPNIRLTLPPIAHLERHLVAPQPLTPPDDILFEQTRLPPIVDRYSEARPLGPDEDIFQTKPANTDDAPHLVDWLDFSRTRSAHFLAEKTCEMICYLWFSSQPSQDPPFPSSNASPPFVPRVATTLQLTASHTFIQFVQKLLETTQVSQSVIVLSLHYIYRLKERNRCAPAQPGSEFRIAVAGLMMANKFLDDNTYTNKTWSEVSGISLDEINCMEREFLTGVDFNLYVDKTTYASWLNLLKGLVMAKERDTRHFRKSRTHLRANRPHNIHGSVGPASRTYSSTYRPPHRARSTSPNSKAAIVPRVVTNPYPPKTVNAASSPSPRPGMKRSAEDAFSPTSATFAHAAKRPMPMSLHIPEYSMQTVSAPSSHSPLETLQSFGNMSIDSPHVPQPPRSTSHLTPREWLPSGTARHSAPETLVAAYSLDEGRRAPVPQNLYFYTLASSPMDNEEETRYRKARLRYHQPPAPSAARSYSLRPPPMQVQVVQSASTSPHDMHMNVTSQTLPHFHDNVWARPPVAAHAYPPPQLETRFQVSQERAESTVPSAPFANAGPPGVHFYPTPVQSSTSVYPHNNWSRQL